MAVGFLRKWFGTGRPASKEVKEAQAELDRLAASRPSLQGPTLLLRDLLPLCVPKPDFVSSLHLDRDAIQAKLTKGAPLLRGEHIGADDKLIRQRWLDICAVVAKHQDTKASRDLAEAMRRGRLSPASLIGDVLAGHAENLVQAWQTVQVDPSLAATVLRMTLFPLFAALNEALTPLREGIAWSHGYCPTCGNWPLLGEFRGLEQRRYLRCGLCTAGWEAARLFCPFCGNRDHDLLGYLHVEGEESSYKAATCNHCRGYVKMMSTLTALPPLPLLVADAASLHLDLIAAERGYACPP